MYVCIYILLEYDKRQTNVCQNISFGFFFDIKCHVINSSLFLFRIQKKKKKKDEDREEEDEEAIRMSMS
jgi:hypothetical protein